MTRIDKSLLRRIKVQAAIEGKSMIDLLSEIVEPELKKREKKARSH